MLAPPQNNCRNGVGRCLRGGRDRNNKVVNMGEETGMVFGNLGEDMLNVNQVLGYSTQPVKKTNSKKISIPCSVAIHRCAEQKCGRVYNKAKARMVFLWEYTLLGKGSVWQAAAAVRLHTD